MGLGKRIGMYLAGIPLAFASYTSTPNIETIIAQDTEFNVTAETTKEDLYKWIVDERIKIINQYVDARHETKAKEQIEFVKLFDPKKAEDLSKDLNIRGRPNKKKVEKIDKELEDLKTTEIEKIYQTGAQKAKENKNEAQDIFTKILEIYKNDKKFDEALEKELNWKKIDGYLLPPEIVGAREKGMKYLADASEGEEDKTEDDLVATLKLENDKIYRRKSRDIIVRSTLNEESAKRAHKVSEATMKLLMEYLGLEGKPPYNMGDKKSTDREPTHRITILTNDDQMDKFAKSTTAFGYQKGVTIAVHESWELKKTKSPGYGHFHKVISFESNRKYFDDQISSCTIENVLDCSSKYINSDTYVDSPWFFSSVVRNFTWQLLGTTLNRKLLSRDDRYKGKIDGITSVETSEKLRAGAYLLAFENKFVPINTLSRMKFDQFTDQAEATAFAATEYLIHSHKDKLVELLTDEYHNKTHLKDISKYEIVEKHFGLTPEQFDKNVQDFVKRNYVGYRNYKED